MDAVQTVHVEATAAVDHAQDIITTTTYRLLKWLVVR